MAKRKALESDEESATFSNDDSSAPEPAPSSKKKAPARKAQTIKKPAIRRSPDSDDDEEAEEPISKKPKRESKPKAKSSTASATTSEKVKTNKDGEKYVDLGKKKHATVRVFKGLPLLDIREFYGDENDLKPGKKGISLTLDQWQTLRDGMNELDQLLQQVKK